MDSPWLVAALFAAVAVLYSAVGHAGASGYLAVMSLMSATPGVMKPTALVLNLLVATIGTARFAAAHAVPWRLLLPFVAASAPLAFVGGGIELPDPVYRRILGGVLVLAAVQILRVAFRRGAPAGKEPPTATAAEPGATRAPSLPVALACGAGIGLLAGLTGTGGGIFLSPLVLLAGWADPRKTAGAAAAFILVNSLAGLAGNVSSVGRVPAALPIWAGAVVVGAALGAGLGARRLGGRSLRALLAVVLVMAGAKLLLTP